MTKLHAALASALALAAFACSNPGEKKQEESGDMVAKTELPPDYQAAIAAWKEDGERWREFREQALTDPALADFLVSNLVDVMVDSYSQSQLSPVGAVPGPFERARADLVYLAWYSSKVLIELVIVGDGVVSFLAGDTLVLIDDPELSSAVAQKLAEPERESRRRAAELLGRLPNAIEDEEQVTALLGRALAEDPEWVVRAQAALAMGERGARARDIETPRRHLGGALADSDPAVVEAACKGLMTLGDPRAIPALIALLERLEQDGGRVATERAVQTALVRLSGEQRERPSREWRAWYKALMESRTP